MIKYIRTYLAILLQDRAFRKSFIKNIYFLFKKTIKHSVGKNRKDIILINLTEHMGDIVATEPVARHLRKQNPDAFIVWCVNQRFADLVRYNPALDAIVTVTCIAEWILLKKMIRKMITVFDLHLNGRSCGTYKLTNKNPNTKGITVFNYLAFGSLLDVFSKTAGIENVENPTPVFHFSGDKNDEVVFPFDYIVFHPLANDQERNWSNEQWNALLKRILDQYPTVHVVEIGLQSVFSNSSPRFHNLTSKYNLQQIAHIIQRARLFIGVESGFGHFANALGTNSVIMFGYYQQYKNYQVYSGRFAEGKDVTLHYHHGKLRHLKMEELWPSIEMRLNIGKQGEKLMRV
jgi:heptosyltransferase-3